MPRLIWLEGAKNDFVDIRRYLHERAPRAATRIGRRILEVVVHLKANPEMGKAGLLPGTREIVVTGTPYVVIYVVEDAGVVILGVVHGARDRAP